MKKYWYIFKANLSASLEYRGALFTWILVELVSLTSTYFIWAAIFRTNSNIAGYDFPKIVSYYLLVPLVGGFTSIFVSEHLPRKIKDGAISSDLMRPHNIAFATLLNQFSIKLTQLTIKLPIYLLLGTILSLAFELHFSILNLLLALLVCFFAYILHFSIDILISYLAFWFDDVWSFSHLKFVTLMVFGGLSFPLDLLPKNLQTIFNILPFRFIYYFPIKVAQGGLSADFIMRELIQLAMWNIVILFLGQLLWKRGLLKYSSYGN